MRSPIKHIMWFFLAFYIVYKTHRYKRYVGDQMSYYYRKKIGLLDDWEK